MKLNWHDVAVYETRITDDEGFDIKRRGWWRKETGQFLGTNREAAQDFYSINCSVTHCSWPEQVEF